MTNIADIAQDMDAIHTQRNLLCCTRINLLKLDQIVDFECKNGKILSGTITRINHNKVLVTTPIQGIWKVKPTQIVKIKYDPYQPRFV